MANNKIITSDLNNQYRQLTTVTGGREVLAKAIGEKQANRILTGQTASNTRVVEPFFSPWVQRTTVELPTQYKELVKWRRYFYHNEPIVQSAVSLHSQFPLSTFWISHADKVIQDSFEKMSEDIELFDFLLEMLQEYWLDGEATPFGFFDDDNNPSVWEGFILLDPVGVDVQWDPLARGRRKEVIKLELSKTIKDVVDGGPNDEKTGELYKKLPQDVIDACRKDGKMSLNTVQVSRIKRTGDYFSVRGTSIIDSAFKWLMYRDKLKSAQYAIADRHVCYDEETECLTREGFKKYTELTMSDEIATVQKDTGLLEYQKPEAIIIKDFKGNMCHFLGKKVDIKVTPEHRMLVQKLKYVKEKNRKNKKDEYEYGPWEICKAKDVKVLYKFRGVVDDWKGEVPFKTISLKRREGKLINNKENGRFEGEFKEFTQDIPLEQYLEFIGYWISEGSLSRESSASKNSQAQVVVYQGGASQYYKDFVSFFDEKFDIKFNKSTQTHKYNYKKDSNKKSYTITTWNLSDNALADHLVENYGTHSYNKRLPIWVKNLPKEYLRILLNAMMKGDGTEIKKSQYTMKSGESKTYKHLNREYYTTSKKLADDVQEIVLKLGYSVTTDSYQYSIKNSKDFHTLYTITWSETSKFGKFPVIEDDRIYKEVPYDGKVWCVTVPNGIFITRRGKRGNIGIQLNSPKEFYLVGETGAPGTQEEIDNFSALLANQWTQPNAAIVYHHALRIQWEGASGKILPLQPEFQYIDKQLSIALLINEGIVTAERQPYASTSIALDVMIQRYLTLRMRVKKWVQQSVFRPICEIHKIIKRTQAELEYGIRFNKKEPDYDIPEVKWDREEIRNDMQKITLLKDMAMEKKIPWKMVLPLLDIDPDEARKGLVEEAKADAAAGLGAETTMPLGGGGIGGGAFPEGPPPGEEATAEEAAELGLPEGPATPTGEGGFGAGKPPESSEASNLPQGI